MTSSTDHDERPSAFEQRVVDMLLAGDVDPLPALRAQWQRARVSHRLFNRFGTKVYFALAIDELPITPFEQEHGDVQFRLEGSEEWRRVSLEIAHGILDHLEYDMRETERSAGIAVAEMSYCTFVQMSDNEYDFEALNTPERNFDDLIEKLESEEEPPKMDWDGGPSQRDWDEESWWWE